MTKEEMAKAYSDGFQTNELKEVAYEAFLCGFGAKCKPSLPSDVDEAAKEYAKTTFKKPYSDNPDEEVTIVEPDKYAGFIAGAKWQYQKDRAKFAQLKAKEWSDGYDEGIAKGKEQMMSEAVEGYVNYYEDSGGILMAEAQVGCPYHNGDKVRVIVLPKED